MCHMYPLRLRRMGSAEAGILGGAAIEGAAVMDMAGAEDEGGKW